MREVDGWLFSGWKAVLLCADAGGSKGNADANGVLCTEAGSEAAARQGNLVFVTVRDGLFIARGKKNRKKIGSSQPQVWHCCVELSQIWTALSARTPWQPVLRHCLSSSFSWCVELWSFEAPFSPKTICHGEKVGSQSRGGREFYRSCIQYQERCLSLIHGERLGGWWQFLPSQKGVRSEAKNLVTVGLFNENPPQTHPTVVCPMQGMAES